MNQAIELEKATPEQLFKHYFKQKHIQAVTNEDNPFDKDKPIHQRLHYINQTLLKKVNTWFDHLWYKQYLNNKGINFILDECLEDYLVDLLIEDSDAFSDIYSIKHNPMNSNYIIKYMSSSPSNSISGAVLNINEVLDIIEAHNPILHTLLKRFFIECNY